MKVHRIRPFNGKLLHEKSIESDMTMTRVPEIINGDLIDSLKFAAYINDYWWFLHYSLRAQKLFV